MQQIDEQFLDECGLAALPVQDRGSLIDLLRDQLATFVGRRLSEGMTEPQLEEFSEITERNPLVVDAWLAEHAADHGEDELFLKIAAENPDRTPADLRAEYAATAWLRLNRPDYRDVVVAEVDALRAKVSAGAEALLRGTAAPDAGVLSSTAQDRFTF